ncbi:MAG: 23S rRNA (pseudouridine(1915)-N(3))-methyltransferase RlmH [Clostridia bacterium]|nr:23S rRNA (pseudouridine(1915)-N(3))-methyltransferase RlmH [Clostridia bacterium]
MQRVTVIAVGRLKDRFYSDAADEYLKRLSAFCKADIIEIPPARLPEAPSESLISAALREEGGKITDRVPKDSAVISLCVEGKRYTSESFSQLISGLNAQGRGIAFIIGGSYGLSEEVKRISDYRMSMSDMTFPHRLARVMLLEQIYRGYMISNGREYHK